MITIHLIDLNKPEKIHTIQGTDLKRIEPRLSGFDVDLVLVHGIKFEECKEFTALILKPIIMVKRGTIIFTERPMYKVLGLKGI